MSYQFSEKLEKKFLWLLERYPEKDAALIPTLRALQLEDGFLKADAMEYLASRLEISPARVKEVASFYSLFRFNDKGQFVLQVCQNITCYLKGAEDIIHHIKEKLGIEEGQSTDDGLFHLQRVECLASCGSAPVMQVNHWDYHEELTISKIDKIIDELKSGKHSLEDFEARKKSGASA